MIKNKGVFSRDPRHERLIQLVEYALQVADPYKAVTSSMELNGRTLIVKGSRIELGKHVHVVGFGKHVYKLEYPVTEQIKTAYIHAQALYSALKRWLK
ncbi:DUF4147 domain-containing protein [Thermofilum sp.]|uniref:DUF4147 domain-containing protein n=1 Tax=Thermofilum sp. TaxID=1961369 RepID=UPI0031671228